MNKHYVYTPENVCATEIHFDIIDGVIWNAEIVDGCKGNSKGVAVMTDGVKAEEVIRRLSGIQCSRGTSCPDQFAKAVKQCLAEMEE